MPVGAEIGGCPQAISFNRAPPSNAPLRKAANTGPTGTIQVKGRSLRFDSRDTGEIHVACE
jgi:hypothetical protein